MRDRHAHGHFQFLSLCYLFLTAKYIKTSIRHIPPTLNSFSPAELAERLMLALEEGYRNDIIAVDSAPGLQPGCVTYRAPGLPKMGMRIHLNNSHANFFKPF